MSAGRATTTIMDLIRAIRRLPADEPQTRPGIWYKTQKEHWLGWLSEYHGPGAYGRKPSSVRDARFAYNHVVNHEMLLWLILAARLQPDYARAARHAAKSGSTMMQKSGALRRAVPWDVVAAALWDSGRPTVQRCPTSVMKIRRRTGTRV